MVQASRSSVSGYEGGLLPRIGVPTSTWAAGCGRRSVLAALRRGVTGRGGVVDARCSRPRSPDQRARRPIAFRRGPAAAPHGQREPCLRGFQTQTAPVVIVIASSRPSRRPSIIRNGRPIHASAPTPTASPTRKSCSPRSRTSQDTAAGRVAPHGSAPACRAPINTLPEVLAEPQTAASGSSRRSPASISICSRCPALRRRAPAPAGGDPEAREHPEIRREDEAAGQAPASWRRSAGHPPSQLGEHGDRRYWRAGSPRRDDAGRRRRPSSTAGARPGRHGLVDGLNGTRNGVTACAGARPAGAWFAFSVR